MGWHWVYGLLTKKKIRSSGKLEYAIANDDFSLANTVPIHKETIGQFTGFRDIDDEKIFEDDFIQNVNFPELIYVVKMLDDGTWSGVLIDNEDEDSLLSWLLAIAPFKIIGNIHDNHELLKGGKNND